jgi:hypothetical protein
MCESRILFRCYLGIIRCRVDYLEGLYDAIVIILQYGVEISSGELGFGVEELPELSGLRRGLFPSTCRNELTMR